MKNFCIVCAATVLAATLVATASAGEHVPASTLSSMGFSSVQVMSDVDGLAVRGKGTFANVWGEGTANYTNRAGSNGSVNGYEAGASHRYGSSTASGRNLSYAGNATVGRYSSLSVNFAGGGSSAYAR